MGGSPYASALGRFKALTPTLLPRDAFGPLGQARDLVEVAGLLERTTYGPELAAAGATYEGPARLEVAINRLFVHRNHLLLQSASFAGKPLLQAYLRRWDVQNIGLILSAKAEARPLAEAEVFLVSSREIPAGLLSGGISLDEYRALLALPSLEAVTSGLVKFGFGGVLLPLLEGYRASHDIFPLIQALDKEYYARLLEQAKFFQGDEWVIREFLRSEIDVRNVLLLLKGKDAELPVDEVLARFLDGGTLTRDRVSDLYNVRGVAELVGQLEPRYPALTEGLAPYAAQRSLVAFETALTRERAVTELRRLKSFPLSICILFTFLLLSELERADLRKVVYGKLYGVSSEELGRSLILPRL